MEFLIDGRFFYLKKTVLFKWKGNYFGNPGFVFVFILLMLYLFACFVYFWYDRGYYIECEELMHLKKEIIKVHNPYNQIDPGVNDKNIEKIIPNFNPEDNNKNEIKHMFDNVNFDSDRESDKNIEDEENKKDNNNNVKRPSLLSEENKKDNNNNVKRTSLLSEENKKDNKEKLNNDFRTTKKSSDLKKVENKKNNNGSIYSSSSNNPNLNYSHNLNLDLNLDESSWLIEEEFFFFEGHNIIGNKWTFLSQLFPDKNPKQMKNHFYSSIIKTLRKVLRNRFELNLKETIICYNCIYYSYTFF